MQGSGFLDHTVATGLAVSATRQTGSFVVVLVLVVVVARRVRCATSSIRLLIVPLARRRWSVRDSCGFTQCFSFFSGLFHRFYSGTSVVFAHFAHMVVVTTTHPCNVLYATTCTNAPPAFMGEALVARDVVGAGHIVGRCFGDLGVWINFPLLFQSLQCFGFFFFDPSLLLSFLLKKRGCVRCFVFLVRQ